MKHDPTLHDVSKLSVEYLTETLGIDWVDAIIASPPCTDFTSSGAWTWKAKDADGRTAASIELVRQVLRCVEYFKPDWWVMENPIGRLPKMVPELARQTPYRFNPADFAGLLDAGLTPAELARLNELESLVPAEISAADVALVKRSERFTKKTCLWGNFNRELLEAAKDPRPAIKVCEQGSPLQRLGKKSAATKEERSASPDGFARAFFTAHDWDAGAVKEWGDEEGDRQNEADPSGLIAIA